MAIQKQVTVGAGAGYTDVNASIFVHYAKLCQNGTRDRLIDYKLPNDSFTAVYTTAAGDFIELVGHGRSGVLGIPAHSSNITTPSVGTVYIQLHANDGSAMTVDVVESESEL